MGTTSALVWALWVSAGGTVHMGFLREPYIAAYLDSREECARVARIVYAQTQWTQGIRI